MSVSPRARVFAGRVLLPLVVTLLLVGAVDHHLRSVQSRQMEADLRDDGDRVSSILQGRLEGHRHLLGAVEAAVLNEADHHPALGGSASWDAVLTREFDAFGAVLLDQWGWRDVRAVAYIDPEGVVRWVYPLEGNERAVGHRLLDSPEVAPFVRRAIETRRPVASDPYILVQGGLGTVVRSPVYLGERLLGLSAVVVEMDVLLRETLPAASVSGLVVWVSDRRGNIVWTNRQAVSAGSLVRVERVDDLSIRVGTPLYPASLFESPLPVARSVIPVADSIWVLHMAPGGVPPVFLWSRAAVALLVSLLCLSLFLLFRTWRRLDGERRRAIRSEENLSSIVGSSPDAIITCDMEGSIRSWNPGAQALFGYTAGEAVGGPAGILFPPDAREACTLAHAAVAREGRPNSPAPVSLMALRKDGSRVPVDFTLGPLVGMGWRGSVAIFRDVTERRQMEAQLLQSAKMAAVGQLASGVAHELNNPLTAVLIYSERLRQKLSVFKLQPGSSHVSWAGDLDRIEAASRRCEKIVRALRTFARQEDQRSTTVDLNEVVRSTLDLLAYRTRQCEVRLDLAGGLPLLQGNPVGLQQVFTNLVVNALDAMPRGGVLSLSTRRAGDHLEARVSDTGEGIPPEGLKRLFEPFYTTKPPGKGTGLGLSISHRIVQDHGGALEARSGPGKGATFVVLLPLGAPPAPGVPPGGRLPLCPLTA